MFPSVGSNPTASAIGPPPDWSCLGSKKPTGVKRCDSSQSLIFKESRVERELVAEIYPNPGNGIPVQALFLLEGQLRRRAAPSWKRVVPGMVWGSTPRLSANDCLSWTSQEVGSPPKNPCLLGAQRRKPRGIKSCISSMEELWAGMWSPANVDWHKMVRWRLLLRVRSE